MADISPSQKPLPRSPDSQPQGNRASPTWRLLLRQSINFFWAAIVIGMLTNLAVNGLTPYGVLTWCLQNPLIALPLVGGIILFTVLERFVSPPLFPPLTRHILKVLNQLLRWSTLGALLTIAVLSYLVPPSRSPLAVTIVPLAVIAFFLFALQIFPWILFHLFQTLREQSSPSTLDSSHIPSRRTFLRSVSLSVGAISVPTVLGSLITRLTTVLAFLNQSPIIITISSSSAKNDWLRDAVDKFNLVSINKGVQVVLTNEPGSLDAIDQILTGRVPRPTIWSPASFLELHLLSTQWSLQHPDEQAIITYTGEFAPLSLVHSPLVFAIWQSREQALSNTPYKTIDWPTLHNLLQFHTWSQANGDSSWGKVKFGHAQPDLSNIGLLTITLMAYAYFGKLSDLSTDDIANQAFQTYFKQIEDEVWCFGPSSGTFMDLAIQRGPNQFDIITTYENLVLTKETEAINRWEPLWMFYPGMNIISDHPFAILQGQWISPAQQKAARDFLDFLSKEEQQSSALTFGLRSYNTSITMNVAGNLFSHPPSFLQIKPEKDLKPLVQPPSGSVIAALIKLWQDQTYDRQC